MKLATVNRKLASLSGPYHRTGETWQSERDPSRCVNGIKQRPNGAEGTEQSKDSIRILRVAQVIKPYKAIALTRAIAK
jgi:hypothetical protein